MKELNFKATSCEWTALYNHRKMMKLSQKQVAAYIGVDHSYYSRLESGRVWPKNKPAWADKLNYLLKTRLWEAE